MFSLQNGGFAFNSTGFEPDSYRKSRLPPYPQCFLPIQNSEEVTSLRFLLPSLFPFFCAVARVKLPGNAPPEPPGIIKDEDAIFYSTKSYALSVISLNFSCSQKYVFGVNWMLFRVARPMKKQRKEHIESEKCCSVRGSYFAKRATLGASDGSSFNPSGVALDRKRTLYVREFEQMGSLQEEGQ